MERPDLQFSAEECALLFASTHMIIGNGQSGKFWEDRWLYPQATAQNKNGCLRPARTHLGMRHQRQLGHSRAGTVPDAMAATRK
jgi:hypothetical protein